MAVFDELSTRKMMRDPEERQAEALQRPEKVKRLKGRSSSVSMERFAGTMNLLTVGGILVILLTLVALVLWAIKLFTV